MKRCHACTTSFLCASAECNAHSKRPLLGVRGDHSCCLCQIGARLIHLALEACRLDVGLPDPVHALSHEILQKEDRKQGMLKLHDVATRRLKSATDVRHLPPPWAPIARYTVDRALSMVLGAAFNEYSLCKG